MADPGFERGRLCRRCGHHHFHINSCNQCACPAFVAATTAKQVQRSADAAGLPAYPVQEPTVVRCASCGAEIVWGIHNGKPTPFDHPPRRAWIPVRRIGSRFAMVSREVYASHLVTCGNGDNHKGRAGHESGPD